MPTPRHIQRGRRLALGDWQIRPWRVSGSHSYKDWPRLASGTALHLGNNAFSASPRAEFERGDFLPYPNRPCVCRPARGAALGLPDSAPAGVNPRSPRTAGGQRPSASPGIELAEHLLIRVPPGEAAASAAAGSRVAAGALPASGGPRPSGPASRPHRRSSTRPQPCKLLLQTVSSFSRALAIPLRLSPDPAGNPGVLKKHLKNRLHFSAIVYKHN